MFWSQRAHLVVKAEVRCRLGVPLPAPVTWADDRCCLSPLSRAIGQRGSMVSDGVASQESSLLDTAARHGQ